MTREPNTPIDERFVELGLEELLGGASAPDVSDRVVAELARSRATAAAKPEPLRTSAPPVHRVSHWGFATGAAASLLACWSLGILSTASSRAVEVAVRAGAVAAWEDEAWVGQPPAGRDSFWLNIGDRLRSQESAPASLEIGSLGMLSMQPLTTIEVLDMRWNDFGKGAALGGVTVAVVSGGLYWVSGDVNSEARAGDRLELRRGNPDADPSMMESAKVADLRDALEREKARVAQLEMALSRQRVAGETEPAADDAGTTEDGKPPAMEAPFHYTGLDDVLAKVDWASMGSTTHELVPVLTELAALIDSGEAPSLELQSKVQALNSKFLAQAPVIAEGIPGEGVNGSFSHPLVVANQMYATFEAAGIPLDNAQRDRMQALAAQYAGEDDQRRAGYSSETSKLQVLLEEMELKERFYAEARGLLDADQLGVVSHPAIQGFTGIELVGTGVAWAPFTRPARMPSLQAYGEKLSSQLTNNLNVSEEQAGQLGAIVQKWAATYPQNLWEMELSPRNRQRMIEVERVSAAARMQLGMVQEILGSLSLTPKQREDLLSLQQVFVPMRQP